MSQNQESNDPYTEYQRILAQGNVSPQNHQQQLNNHHPPLPIITVEVPQEMAELVPKKVYIPAIRPPIVLDTTNRQEQQFNQTVKRVPASQFLSPQYSRNSQTKSQIRMKILLENTRLKSNVETLRKDLDNYRVNELKVTQILKETKQKISEFKNALKEKSKRITQVTQNNIHLRTVISEMQSKLNHLTSYSQWQQGQIRDLNGRLQQKSAEVQELKSFQATIDKYENILKNYEMNLFKHNDQNLSNEVSRCSLNAEMMSIHTMSERSPEKWGTMNQLGMQQVNNLKQKHENVSSNQDYEILSDENSNLRMKVNDLQKELQAIKEQIGQRQKEWQNSMMKNLSKSDTLKIEIQKVKNKSEQMQYLLKEREEQIDRLSKEIIQMKEDLEKKREINKHSQRSYLQEIEQLNKIIDGKDEQINQLKEKVLQRQDYIKKIQYEQYLTAQEKQLKFDRDIKQLQQKIKKTSSRNEQLQKKNEYLTAKIQQIQSNQEQSEHHLQLYRKALQEKQHFLETIERLKNQNEELNYKLKQQKHLYEERLEQAHQEIAAREQDKNIESLNMEKYGREISELKSKLESISYQQFQQNRSHYQRVIEEQHEEQESVEESSILREGELQGNKQYYSTSRYDKEQARQGPLDQQQPLRSSSQSSRAEIRIPKPQSSPIKQNLLSFQQKLQQERSSHNISLVQINYKLDDLRQRNINLQNTINELQQKIKLMSIESVEKKLAFEIKEEEMEKLRQKLEQTKMEYQQYVEQLNRKITKDAEQLKQKSEVNFQLGLELDRMKSQNMQMSHRVYNLESTNKKNSSQRVTLENELTRMKNQWNNISEQNNAILEKKIEELKSSLEGQLQTKYQQENQLYFSMQMQQKENQIQAQAKAKLANLEERINQLQLQLQKSQEKDAAFNRDRVATNHKIELLQQEVQELQNKCRKVEQTVRQKEEQIKQQLERLQQNQVELKIKEYESDEATLKINQQEQQKRRFMSQKQAVVKQIQSKQVTIEDFQEKITAFIKNEEKYQKDKQQYGQRIQMLQTIIQEQKDSIQKTIIEKQVLANNNLKISTDITQFNSKLKQLQDDKQSLNLKLTLIQKINAQFSQQINQFKIQKQNLKKQNLQLTNEIKQIQQTIKIKDTKIEELDNNVANLLSSLEYSQTENSEKLNTLRQSLTKQNQLYLSVKMEEVLNTKRELQLLRNQIVELKRQQKSTQEEYVQFKAKTQKQKEEFMLKNCESCAKIEELEQANINFSKSIQAKSNQIISITNAVNQKELILQQKTHLIDAKVAKIGELESIIDKIKREIDELKQKTEKQKQTLSDNIEVRKKLMQELEDDHEMKVNKLQKQISNLKLMVNQTQKQASERLERSTHTITEMQNKLKMQIQLTKQKDEEIKGLRQTNNALKEVNEMLKKSESRFQQQRQKWQQIKHEKEEQISSIKAEMVKINNQLSIQIKKNEQIQNQSLKITVELNKFRTEIEEVLSQKLSIQNELKQLKVKVSKAEHEKLFMSTTNQNLQLKNKKLEEELTQLKKEYQASQSQIQKTRVYLQDEILEKSKMEQLYQNIQIQKEELCLNVNHLSAQRLQIQQKARKATDTLNAKIIQLEKQIIKLEKEKKEVEDSLTKTREYLQEEILEKSKVEQLHQKMLQEKQQMELKLSRVVIEFDQIRQSAMNNSAIEQLKEENEGFKLRITKMEKQHANRLQLMRTQTRDHGLELQRKHSKQVEDLCEQLSKLRSQRDNYKVELDKAKKVQKQLKEQIQKLKQKMTKYEKQTKQFENQRGQITDKILQLTQQNNEFNEIIQNLRNDVMSKGNELFEYKQIIEKLQEEIEQLKTNQPISNESLQPQQQIDNELEQEYYQLKAVVLQLQAKNEILQTQINEKIKNERVLVQKLEQLKVRETRERNSSCDSYVSRSRIFIDEKSQNMQAELQDYKCKYESAQAYIQTLEQQIKQSSNSQLELKIAQLEKEINVLKQQNQNLQAKVQYQNAYIDHLQSDNIKNSVISKKSNQRRDDKGLLKVEKDHSVVSIMQHSHRTDRPAEIEKINDKIKSVNDFIEKFNREKDNAQILKQFRKKLSNATLDQLLSTILYRLDKQANHFREKQHQNEQISMDNQQLQQEIKEQYKTLELMTKKLQLNNNIQTKYEQAKTMLQQTLMVKVKQQMEIAQFKRRIQQLENMLPQNGQESLRNKEQKMLSASVRREKQKERLSVLHQENEDISSDSIMSENADSQIPSSVHQSKDLKCSLDFKLKTSENLQLKKKKLSRTNSLSNIDRTFTIQFLYKLLDKIDQIDSQVAYIQIQLEDKAEKLTEMLGNGTTQESLVGQLQEIQTKLHDNEKDLRRHKQKAQNLITNLFRQFIKSIEIQDQSGFPLQSKKKIEEYLKLLEQQLTKSKQLQQDKSELSRTETSPQKLRLNLHEIKQDIINEDKSSSIVNPKTSRAGHSYSNSQGGAQSLQNNQMKANYFQVLKELKQANDELSTKQEKLRNMTKRNNIITCQISSILDQLLLNFDQNQYLFQQTDKIKQFLNQITGDDVCWTPVKDSYQKGQEYDKMMLIESNAKKQTKQEDVNANYVLQLTKLSKSKFNDMIEQIANEQLKAIKKTFQQAIQSRYDDCMQFLNNQQSLILDILKVNQQTSAEEQIMQKLANKLTKQEITDIITNSSNKKEARMTLLKIIAQDTKSQMISNQNDFSPDNQKMHQIRNKVFIHPTELSLLLHNQLVKILGAPTRQSFYDLIEQFYQIIRRQEQKINQQTSERESLSENHSMRLKKLLEQPLQSMQIDDSQRLDHLQIRVSKLRSSSCVVNGSSEGNIAK